MLKNIKLEMYEEDEIIDIVQIVTNTDPLHLIESLEVFRQKVNEKLTQKIVHNDNFNDSNMDEEINSSEDEEASENPECPKKRKT